MIGLSKQKEEKGLYISEARFVGMQTPGAIYKVDDSLVKPRIMTTKIHGDTKWQKGTVKKTFEKSSEPAPGQYDIDKSFAKIKPSIYNHSFSKKKPANFIDVYRKQKEYLPSVGHYKNSEEAYKKISSNPPSIRTKRH